MSVLTEEQLAAMVREHESWAEMWESRGVESRARESRALAARWQKRLEEVTLGTSEKTAN